MTDHTSSDDERLTIIQIVRPFDAGSVHEETIELEHGSINGTLKRSTDKPKLSSRSIWFTIILIYTITLSDGIASELVALFLPDMCKNRFGIPEDKLGSYVGVLSGAVSFANFLSSFIIGHISDTKGRKIVVLIGIGSVALNTFLLGIAPTFTFALATRLLLGLTNGNTPVVKASLSDITTGSTRALAFAYLGATWSLSRAMSNMVSGFTTGIVFASDIAIFNNNAYLVPCLIGAGATFIVFCLSIGFYPETLHLGKEAYKKELIEKYGFVPEKAVKHDSNPVKDIFLGIKIILTDPLMRKLFIIFCTNSFANGGILVAMVLFYYLPTEYHGLGFTTMEVGIAFSIFGAASFIFQIGFFKRMLNKFGLYKNYSIGTVLFFFSSISIPFANMFFWMLGDTILAKVLTFIYLTLSSSVTAIAFMLGLSVMGVMISNAADPERQGLTQGACASFSALVRAFGPVVSGFIFTFSVSHKFPHLLFFFLAILYAICFVLHRTISLEDRIIVEPKKEHGRIPEDEKKVELHEVNSNHSNNMSSDEEDDLVIKGQSKQRLLK